MTLDIAPIERSLLTGRWKLPQESTDPTLQIAEDIVQGRFRAALTSPAAQRVFQSLTLDGRESSDTEKPEDELIRLALGVACLHAFIQVNWTGPDLDIKPSDILPHFSSSTPDDESAALNRKAISELTSGGEPAYHLVQSAMFLRLAQTLFGHSYLHCRSAPWWRLRTHIVHQQILDEPSVMSEAVLRDVGGLQAGFSSDPELLGRLQLEIGLLHHLFAQERVAAEYFVKAARATGLEYELTGALGKRTKFQQNELSQLVLLAESALKIEGNSTPTTISDSTVQAPVPEALALNDDVLLEQTEFTSSHPSNTGPLSQLSHLDPSNQPALHPVDQCVLLSLCLNIKNTSPVHGLTGEQMAPYVSRVISHPRNWSIHTMALLLRSRLESTRTRTVERSALQLQALVDQMPTADSSLSERLLYFHTIPLPSKWDLERELAERFLALGVVRSAMEIFERLEMFEEVVKCWVSLERPEKGIAIVKDLLEGRKTESELVVSRGKTEKDQRRRDTLDVAREAKLYCILGDLEPDNAEAHYQRAWSLSKETSGRAMRALGGWYFARGQFAQSISCLKKAVAINPLLSRTWFILGCAAVRLEDWEEGKKAFSRCVAIDEEDGESWNNLASMYLRMGTSAEMPQDRDSDDDHESDDEARSTANPSHVPSSGENPDAGAGVLARAEDAKSVPFAHKMLAFRALKQGLKFSYSNWRMWTNYMIVAMDVGELNEAARALGRVVQETHGKSGANSVDEDVLDRLVNAVTRAPTQFAEDGTEVRSQNEGQGLALGVVNLLERTILPHVSSPRIFRAYARLLTWQAKWDETIKAYLDAYRASPAATMDRSENEVKRWREAVLEVEEIVDVLQNFGPKVEGLKWKVQARSIVRTFIGRTKDFENEPEWAKLIAMQDDLKKVEE